VWFLCHGYGQLASDFIARAHALDAPDRLLVAPEALSRFYVDRTRPAGEGPPTVGASWMTREDRDHEIMDQLSYLDAVYDHVMARIAEPPARVCALGFSQGVATVIRWLLGGRSRFDDVIAWAGSWPLEIDPARDRERLASVRLSAVFGARDALQPWVKSEETLARLAGAGLTVRVVEFSGGHRLDDETLRAVAASVPRDATPGA
jgi:predicted esterase